MPLIGSIGVSSPGFLWKGGGGTFTDLTFIDSSLVNTTTVTIPSSSKQGDFAILFDGNLENETFVTPSGWTSIVTDHYTGGAASKAGVAISYKKLTLSDPGSTVTGISTGGATNIDKILLVFRPDAGSISTITPTSINSNITGVAPASQTITTSTGSSPLILFANYYAYGAIATRGLTGGTTSPTEISNGTGPGHYVKYAVLSGSNFSNRTASMSDSGSINSLQSFYIQFT